MTAIKPKARVDSPLQGIRVLELAQYIAGPLAGQQLADFGAEVIKIERPGSGDPFRSYAGGRNVENYGFNYRAYNRNKKSLALDLGTAAGQQVVKRIAAGVDVVLENFRPGVLDRLGIGYAALREVNPRIIYCAVSGFSGDGPYRNRPAFDTVGQALSGILYLFLDPDHPQLRGPTVADQATALQAATAIMAMLCGRERNGEGGRIDITMVDAAAAFIPDVYAGHTDAGVAVLPDSRVALSQAFVTSCADGKLLAVQLGGLDKAFSALITELGCPALADDPRFRSRPDRSAHWSQFVEALRPYFAQRPLGHWMQRFFEVGVPCSEVLTIPEVFECPEVVHSGLFETREHPQAGPMTLMKRPARINQSRGPEQSFAPLLGEHSEPILRDVGYSDDEIASMRAAGVLG